MNVCLIDCIDGPNSLLLLLKIGHSAPLFHSELDTILSLVIEMLSNRTQSEVTKVLVHWDSLSYCPCSFSRTMRPSLGELARKLWGTPGGELCHHYAHYADHPTPTRPLRASSWLEIDVWETHTAISQTKPRSVMPRWLQTYRQKSVILVLLPKQ